MGLSISISPVATRQSSTEQSLELHTNPSQLPLSPPPSHQSKGTISTPKPPAVKRITWQEHALRKNWELAILAYLRQDWRATYKLWQMISSVVSESLPHNRSAVREANLIVVKRTCRECY